jgi:hypothetical protein
MGKRFFVDETVTDDGKYRVLQEDSITKESFGVKDFDTKEEAQRTAVDMQRAVDNALSEEITLTNITLTSEASADVSVDEINDTFQDLRNENSR